MKKRESRKKVMTTVMMMLMARVIANWFSTMIQKKH